MTIDRWNLIEEIFQGALELPSTARRQYIENACGDDGELRSEVQSLLESDEDAERVLSSLVGDDLKELVQGSSSVETGLQVGPYHLVRELDSGGMGAVYLAVRSDDQYFQIVAIKMIRRGLESPDLVQRFRRERQTLATLNHPNIGAILDGGETADGRPFIVMEYVEGQPITSASDSRSLSIRSRVELFRSVCSAVHYAHQKLVIHRDIKPSNVLVTPESVVKLIDFGISKPFGLELTTDGLSPTLSHHRLMTPDYASPEQLLGQPLTTTTDIYSLGVLLFELLSGSRPYSLRDLSPAAAERVVCHQEIRKPSSVPGLSKQTRKELTGDLDRIVLMAMDQDPSRRYLSAQHLDEDLLRYLQGKPVLARRATAAYRLSKCVQRHKPAALMACAILIVLISSSLLYSWQSRRADRRVKQVATLADSAISDMTEKLQQSSMSVETQAALFHSALQHLDQLRQSSGNDPRLLLELSKAYERVGDLEGSPSVANLGNSGTALSSYQEALRTAIEAHARLPGDESTKAVVVAYQRLAGIETFLGNIREARDNYEKSLPFAVDLWRQKPEDDVLKRLLAINYVGIGDVELSGLAPDKALRNYQEAFQVFGDVSNGNEEHDRTITRLYLHTARAQNELGLESETLVSTRRAIAAAEGLTQEFPSGRQVRQDLFSAYQNMVLVLAGRDMMNVGDSRQAQVYAHKALEIAKALAASDNKNMQTRDAVAFADAAMGDSFRLVRPTVAAVWYRKSLLLTKEMAPHYGSAARHAIAERNEALAEVLVDREHAQERLQLLQEANPIRKELAETSAHGRIHLMSSYCKLSDAELAVGNLRQAEQFRDSALSLLDEFRPNSPSLLVLRDIGRCYESIGNVQQRIAVDRSSSTQERQTAEAEARLWYGRSADLWSEWNRRGVATPESESQRREVERRLGSLQRFSH